MKQRAKFDMQATPSAQGFEIAAMTAGVGNGWTFTREALVKSVGLWEKVEVFVDHVRDSGVMRSVRDLGGVLYNARFDDVSEGIVANLRAVGPSAALVRELGREMLSEGEPKPRIGFSADVGFLADGNTVVEILRVFSVDLVFDPARGGAFLRAINSAQNAQGGKMEKCSKCGADLVAGVTHVCVNPVDKLRAEMQTLLGVEQEREKEVKLINAARVQMCEYLLDAGLAASNLPASMQEHVRAQFAGKMFEAKELTQAIANSRKLLSELTADKTVQGVSGVRSMFDTRDQLQAAVDDLLDAPREKGAEGLQVARLSGIKELYMSLTGDRDLYGGYFADRAQFQHTTANFAGLVKNALNKSLVRHWDRLGVAGYDWWTKIATVEHFETINQIAWLIFGSVSSLPEVAEGAEYTELKIGDSPETSTFTKYGGYVGLTLEAIDRDDTRKLRAIPRELANAALRNISSLVAALFTSNTNVGPTLADTGALFNATAVTTAGGHANLLTTALGSAYATAWDAIGLAMYNQPMLVANETGYYGTGKKVALWPKFILVPGALRSAAETLFVPRWASVLTAPGTMTAGAPSWGGQVEVVTVPEWTSATNYAGVQDPALMPGIMIGERFGIKPEIYVAGDELSPAVFMNDESRIKVRHFVAVGVADFRPLHKTNV